MQSVFTLHGVAERRCGGVGVGRVHRRAPRSTTVTSASGLVGSRRRPARRPRRARSPSRRRAAERRPPRTLAASPRRTIRSTTRASARSRSRGRSRGSRRRNRTRSAARTRRRRGRRRTSRGRRSSRRRRTGSSSPRRSQRSSRTGVADRSWPPWSRSRSRRRERRAAATGPGGGRLAPRDAWREVWISDRRRSRESCAAASLAGVAVAVGAVARRRGGRRRRRGGSRRRPTGTRTGACRRTPHPQWDVDAAALAARVLDRVRGAARRDGEEAEAKGDNGSREVSHWGADSGRRPTPFSIGPSMTHLLAPAQGNATLPRQGRAAPPRLTAS